jgi:hypothetical protein
MNEVGILKIRDYDVLISFKELLFYSKEMQKIKATRLKELKE